MTPDLERPAARRSLRWDECSLIPGRRGVRWWLVVCLTLALTTAGLLADLQRQDQLGPVFQLCYFLGCLSAVVAVQRRELFGPMMQPPLVLVITLPGVLILTGAVSTDGGTTATALAVGTPLINGFPAMAITSGTTVAVGVLRLLTQRRPTGVASTDLSSTRTRRDAGPADRPAARRTGTATTGRVREPLPRRGRPTATEPTTETVRGMADQVLRGYDENRAARRGRRPRT